MIKTSIFQGNAKMLTTIYYFIIPQLKERGEKKEKQKIIIN